MLEPYVAPAAFLTVHIAAWFLALTAVYLTVGVARCARSQSQPGLLRPRGFLLASLLFMTVSVAVGLAAGSRAPLLADWIFAEALGITLSLLSPVAAVSFLTANLFLRPWELVPGNPLFEALPKGLAALALFSWIWHSLLRRRFQIRIPPAFMLLVGFLVWLFFADFAAGNSHSGWPYLFNLMLPVAVLAVLTVNAVHHEQELKMLAGSLAIAAVGLIVSAIVQTHVAVPSGRLQTVGLLGNSNDLAAVAVLALPFLLYLFVQGKPGTIKFLFGLLAAAAMLYALWLSQSRGAKLALLAALAGYLFFCSRLTYRKAALTVLLLVAMVPFFIGTFRQSQDLSGSTAARLSYVVTGWRMLRQHPFFGVGVGNYPKLYQRFTPSLIESGERTAHSSWVLVMAESGLPALALFLLLYLAVFFQSWRLRRSHPPYFLAMLSYGISMTFLSHTYLFLPYLLFAMVIAAKGIGETELERQDY